MLGTSKQYESTSHQEICRETDSHGQGSGPDLGGMLPHGCCRMEKAASEPWASGAKEAAGRWSRCCAGQLGCTGEQSLNQERKPGAIGTYRLAEWRLQGDGIAVHKYIKGVNTREGRELFKLRDNAGIRRNGTN